MSYFNFIYSMFSYLLFVGVAYAQCWKNTSCSGPSESAFPGPWETNIFAPTSRTVSPAFVLSKDGGQLSTYKVSSLLATNGSQLVFDFGREVGGLISLSYTTTGLGAGAIGLAFSESKNWIGEWSDSSNGGFKGPDGAIYASFYSSGQHSYTMPDLSLRGGFRYLTLFLVTNSSTTSVEINNITLDIGFQPTWSNLRAYQGYFHSNDDELNKIWYSGAYTLQTNSVPVNTGRQVPFMKNGWANNGTLGGGETIIVDGAKRDRAVWPGDMGIAVPSTFVSIGDLDSVKNALQVMYDYQNPTTGAFPEAGPPLLQLGSDTYHMWTMIGTYNYILYTNDTSFLAQNWDKYILAMDFIYGKVTYPSGLLNVTGLRDWARWQTGYNQSSAQMILYKTLTTGANLATWNHDTTGLSQKWISQASALKSAINTFCFSSQAGLYKDNATSTTLHPQDANSLAILFNVSSPSQSSQISHNLLQNWTPIGPSSPELPGNISPFITSFEIQSHFSIGETARALDLIRRTWGWYLSNPLGTESTVIEGYLVNGTFGYRSTRGYDYDASYVSHSHGWSSGPTAALTTFVLGLSVQAPAGREWKLAPQFGDLTDVQGGFVTGLGKFQAAWKKADNWYGLNYTVPVDTSGVIELPILIEGKRPKVVIDGMEVKQQNFRFDETDSIVVLNGQGGGHSIIVS